MIEVGRLVSIIDGFRIDEIVVGNGDDAEGRGVIFDPLIVGLEIIGKMEGVLIVKLLVETVVKSVVGYIVVLTAGQDEPAGHPLLDGRYVGVTKILRALGKTVGAL
jgi:hypothetical protein